MKTLTEFSGLTIRLAAKALAEAKAALPKELPPNEIPTEGSPAAPVVDGEATKVAFDAAISAASGVSGERLDRLREALEVVGTNTADVRVVRVYAGDEPVAGAKKHGAHQYIVDSMPQSMKQVSARPEKPRAGRGDRDRGPKRAEGSLSGGFSMDSIKEDRGGSRRGPPPAKPGAPKS
jgi:hypothetical protein